MPVSNKGSSARVKRTFFAALLMVLLLGCGSDLPRDSGGGTVSGRVFYSGEATNPATTLSDPWLVIFASAEPLTLTSDFRFQSARAVPCDSIPQEGFYYKLTGLYPGHYFIMAVIITFAVDGTAVPHSLGAYPNLCAQSLMQTGNVMVKADSLATDENNETQIDFTVYDSLGFEDPCFSGG